MERIDAQVQAAVNRGDLAKARELIRETAEEPILARAVRITQLTARLAELEAARPALHAQAAAARQRANEAVAAIRAAEQAARMVARESGLAEAELRQHNELVRSLRDELAGLQQASKYQSLVDSAPVVHDLSRMSRPKAAQGGGS